MPTLHDLMTGSVAADADALAGESAPGAVRARIRAVRTRRAVLAGSGATLAVGAAAFASLSEGGRAALKPATLAAGPGTITIPLDEAGLREQKPYPTCGEPAPAAQLASSGYTLNPGTQLDGRLHFAPRLTYSGAAFDAVTVEDPVALVLADGVVVASFGSGLDSSQVVSIEAGFDYQADLIYPGGDQQAFIQCPEVDHSGGVVLPSGDYQVVLVQAVHRSAMRLAIADITEAGYPVAPSDAGTWVPGSIDCDEAIREDILGESSGVLVGVPIQCEPFGVEGVTIDEDAGTITLPLAPYAGEGDVNVILASEPVPWVIEDPITFNDIGMPEWASGALEDARPELACGADEQDWWGYPLEATTEATFDDLMADGGELAIDIDSASRAQQAEISLDPTAEAWVLWRRGGTVRVAGHATATLGDSELSIDRAVDYAHTSLTLGDIEWCDDPFGTGTDFLGEGIARRVLVISPSTITGTSGDVDRGELIVVEVPLPQ